MNYQKTFVTDFAGYSAKFSPYRPSLIATASSQYFGMTGNGRLAVYDLEISTAPLASLTTKDGAFDITWSEASEGLLVAGVGDGSLIFWNYMQPGNSNSSVRSGAHSGEVASIDWSCIERKFIVSAGWDGWVRVWDVERLGCSTGELHAGPSHCYQATFSPHNPGLIAAVNGEGNLFVMDRRSPQETWKFQLKMTHGSEVLSCDWNKYRPSQIATGSVDRNLRVWDIRNPSSPVSVVTDAHGLAIRKVKFDPFTQDELVSCS